MIYNLSFHGMFKNVFFNQYLKAKDFRNYVLDCKGVVCMRFLFSNQ
jgi:hypothetical protein